MARSSSEAQIFLGSMSLAFNCRGEIPAHRAIMENERIVSAIPITRRGCRTGASALVNQDRSPRSLPKAPCRPEPVSSRIRVSSCGGGSASATRPMKAIASRASLAISAQPWQLSRCASRRAA